MVYSNVLHPKPTLSDWVKLWLSQSTGFKLCIYWVWVTLLTVLPTCLLISLNVQWLWSETVQCFGSSTPWIHVHNLSRYSFQSQLNFHAPVLSLRHWLHTIHFVCLCNYPMMHRLSPLDDSSFISLLRNAVMHYQTNPTRCQINPATYSLIFWVNYFGVASLFDKMKSGLLGSPWPECMCVNSYV